MGQKTNTMPVDNSLDQTKSNLGKERGKHPIPIDVSVNGNFENSQKENWTPKKGGDTMRCTSGM